MASLTVPRPPRAVLFGSIGTLVETSDIQRRAFNAAFLEAGVPWQWSEAEYRDMLGRSGGRDRIAADAEARGVRVDAAALHARKTEIFRAMIGEVGLPLRAGVADVLAAAQGAGVPAALVATTAPETVADILARASHPGLAGAFRVTVTAADAPRPKPAPDAYAVALERLGVPAQAAVAIEDSPVSAGAARAAGLPTVAFPGAFHAHRAFDGVAASVDRLTPAALGLDVGALRAAAG